MYTRRRRRLQTFPPKMGVVENDVRNDNYTVPPPPQRSLSISLESTLSPACISLTAKFSRTETGGTKSLRRLMTTTGVVLGVYGIVGVFHKQNKTFESCRARRNGFFNRWRRWHAPFPQGGRCRGERLRGKEAGRRSLCYQQQLMSFCFTLVASCLLPIEFSVHLETFGPLPERFAGY